MLGPITRLIVPADASIYVCGRNSILSSAGEPDQLLANHRNDLHRRLEILSLIGIKLLDLAHHVHALADLTISRKALAILVALAAVIQ